MRSPCTMPHLQRPTPHSCRVMIRSSFLLNYSTDVSISVGGEGPGSADVDRIVEHVDRAHAPRAVDGPCCERSSPVPAKTQCERKPWRDPDEVTQEVAWVVSIEFLHHDRHRVQHSTEHGGHG